MGISLCWYTCRKKGKRVKKLRAQRSLPSVEAGADPGVQARQPAGKF